LAVSGVDVPDIDLIIPHGIGTRVTDEYEARAMVKVFGKGVDRPLVAALKPYTGHTLGSTALLETAMMLSALEKECVPATLNCERPDTGLPVNVARETIKSRRIQAALKTSCGFAGFDGACVFKKV